MHLSTSIKQYLLFDQSLVLRPQLLNQLPHFLQPLPHLVPQPRSPTMQPLLLLNILRLLNLMPRPQEFLLQKIKLGTLDLFYLRR